MVNDTQTSKVKAQKTSSHKDIVKAKSCEKRKFKITRKFITNMLGIVLIAACVILCIIGYRKGLFTSLDTLQSWVRGFGIVAPLIFIIFQAIQVAVPIIPGGVTLLGGVIIFGSWWGFWYNYIGIVLGSLAVFAISRNYGKPLMHKLFSEEAIEKYESWTSNHGRFAKLFAAAIFLPGAPDGLICYLAGTTEMTWKTYSLIILLCKPMSIALYSLGLVTVEGFTSWLS
ncbi:MAG: TVP38/TMEM64 family protein [Acutalibacteraceae bacterium]